jgi:hypothetical protein
VTESILETEGDNPGSAKDVSSVKETTTRAMPLEEPQQAAEELFVRIRYDCHLLPRSNIPPQQHMFSQQQQNQMSQYYRFVQL